MSKPTIYAGDLSFDEALEEQLDCISSINLLSDVLERYLSCDGSINKIDGVQYLLNQVSDKLHGIYEELEEMRNTNKEPQNQGEEN